MKNSLLGSGSIVNEAVENSRNCFRKKYFVGNNCIIEELDRLNDVYLGDNIYIETVSSKRIRSEPIPDMLGKTE